jgi:hypothetical protein
MNKTSRLTVYPFLLAVFPILALWNHNAHFVELGSVARSLAITLVAVGFLLLLFRLIFKDWHKAGLSTTLSALLFFSYGHAFLFATEYLEPLTRHRYLVALFTGLFLLGVWLVVKRLRNPERLERFLTITGILLVATSILQLTWYEYSVYRASADTESRSESGIDTQTLQDVGNLPDVFWIILDAYGRSDVLQEYYGYDNADFLERLTEMGFYVATCSQTNYPDTILSILSTMNLDYLQNVVSESGALPQLSKSVVRKTFDALGYKTITFENYFGDHFDLFEDTRLSRQRSIKALSLFSRTNEFEAMLKQTSLLRLFVDNPQLVPSFLHVDEEDSWHYELYLQTKYIFDTLPTLPSMEGPNFFFVHLVVPHTPYIYSPDGNFLLTENTSVKAETIGYRNNVAFVDNWLPDVLQSIIDNSENPPVIIIQGDHGPTSRDARPEKRLPILNAYYLSDDALEDLYPDITPVNTFRLIFNHYFESDYEYLEDLSYNIWGKGKGGFPDEKIFPNQCDLDE